MPNIIYILADDLGYGDIGAFNPDCRIPTPNIDRLAAEGMTFTDAHSSSAVCTPSRYSILTGRYCWRTSLKHGVLYGYEPPLIERDRPTVASLLKRAGYTTACIGKWHLGLGYHVKPGCHFDFARPLPWGNAAREDEEKIDFARGVFDGPTALGFDYFFGCSGCPTCQPPYGFIENERFVEIPSEYRPRPPFAGRPGTAAPSWQHKEADPTFARGPATAATSCGSSTGWSARSSTPSSAPGKPTTRWSSSPATTARSRATACAAVATSTATPPMATSPVATGAATRHTSGKAAIGSH